jgi:hypothetical protein
MDFGDDRLSFISGEYDKFFLKRNEGPSTTHVGQLIRISAIPVDRPLGPLRPLNRLEICYRAGLAMLPTEHLFDRRITLSSLPAGIRDLQLVCALHADPLRFGGWIAVVVEFYVRPHLLALLAKVPLLLMDHGFGDLLFLDRLSFVLGLGTRGFFKTGFE